MTTFKDFVAFLIVVVMLTACSSTKENTAVFPSPVASVGTISFIQRREPQAGEQVAHMTAQTTGELILTDGCFRLQRAESDSIYLLIWPRGFSARLENGRYQVLDDEGDVVAQVGDFLHLSGGEIPSDMASGFAEALPAQCSWPALGCRLAGGGFVRGRRRDAGCASLGKRSAVKAFCSTIVRHCWGVNVVRMRAPRIFAWRFCDWRPGRWV